MAGLEQFQCRFEFFACGRCIASGTYPEHWPSGGHIRELSELAGDLQRMAMAQSNAPRPAPGAPRPPPTPLQTAVRASFSAAVVSGLKVALAAVIAGFFVILLIPGRPLREHPEPQRAEAEAEAELESEARLS